MNRKTLRYNIIFLFLLAILFSSSCIAAVYYTTSLLGSNDKDCSTLPVDQPCLDDMQIVNYANVVVFTIYIISSATYPQAFSHATRFFTKSGWENFIKSPAYASTLKIISQKSKMIFPLRNGTPELIKKGVEDKRYTWEITVPVKLNIQSTTAHDYTQLTVTTKLFRTSGDEGQNGIGIETFEVK